LGSGGGGLAGIPLSAVTEKRRRTSESRHEFGDSGLRFTPGDEIFFFFPSLQRRKTRVRKSLPHIWVLGSARQQVTHSGAYGAEGGGGTYRSNMAAFPLLPAASEASEGCRVLERPGGP